MRTAFTRPFAAPALALAAILLCATTAVRAVETPSPDLQAGDRLAGILDELDDYKGLPVDRVLELGQEGLDLLESAPDPARELRVRRALSWGFSTKGDAETGLDHGHLALELACWLDDREAIANAEYLIGVARWYQGDVEAALQAATRAAQTQRNLGDFKAVATTLTLMGAIQRGRGAVADAFEYHLQALELSEDLKDRRGITRSQVNIGLIYWNVEDHEEAKNWMSRAIDSYRELDDPRGLTKALGNLGLIYIELDEPERALPYLEEVLQLAEEHVLPRTRAIAYSNLAFAHDKLDKPEEAIRFYHQALSLRESFPDHRGMARNLTSVAGLWLDQDRVDDALSYLKRAVVHAERADARREQASIWRMLGQAHEASGSQGEALDAYRRAREIQTALDVSDGATRMANLEARRALEQKNQKLKDLEQEQAEQAVALERQKLLRTGLIAGTFLLCVVASILWWQGRSRKRALARARESNRQLTRTTAELQELGQRYRSVFDDVSEARLFVDLAESAIIDANAPATELCGCRKSSLRGTPLVRLQPEWLARPLASLDPAMSEESCHEVDWTDRDGNSRRAEIWVSPLTLAERACAFVSVHDITERHRVEEERIRRDKLESLGLLAGGIAHDFNNALTAILGYVSIAQVQVRGDSEVYPLLDGAESAINQAGHLTSQLLAFSKGGEPRREVSDVYHLLREAVRFALSGSAVEVEFKIAADLWPAELDRGQFKQVISNLVINADQAMGGTGQLTVRAHNHQATAPLGPAASAGNYVQIEIEDSGPGIPANIRDKILDPYFTTKEEGSGLGLATAFAVLTRHRGWLEFESIEGRGTTFTASFPASPDATLTAHEDGASEPRGQGYVLVMDDDPLIQNVYRVGLNSLGYEVEVAGDGDSAIRRYREAGKQGRGFDLVIMDLTIPGGMGGKEAMEQLRKLDPRVRGVVASGYSQDPVMSDYRSYGFAASLAKPFSIQELGRVLARVASSRAHGRLRAGRATQSPPLA